MQRNNHGRLIPVLLLEPDFWRYIGISHTLSILPEIQFLGDKEHNKILAMTEAPKNLNPGVIMISHSLIIDFKLSLLDRIHELFPAARILVHGYEDSIDAIAQILVVGATGYFLLSSSPDFLSKALNCVHQGLIWGPREATSLILKQLRSGKKTNTSRLSRHELVTHRELMILKELKLGMNNKEIANKFGIAEITVKCQLTKLYKRFNVNTRLQLLSYVFEHNLLNAETFE